jgi:chitinase
MRDGKNLVFTTIFTLAMLLVPALASAQTAKRFVAYFTEWGIYDHNYFPADIPADKLTHINYAFIEPVGPDANGNYACAIVDSWAAKENDEFPRLVPGTNTTVGEHVGTLNQLRRLRAWRRENGQVLSLLLSVGGASGSGNFAAASSTSARRTSFVNSCVNLMMAEAFDGLDIDWEFPANATQKANFTALMQQFRSALNSKGNNPRTGSSYLLTMAGPGDNYYLSRFDVAGIQPYLDWVNVMSYDFHGCWGGTDHTGHNAPLYGSANDPDGSTFGVSQGISDWIGRGMPASKLLLGLPYYGKAFQALTNTGPNGSYPGRHAGVDPAQNDGTTCAPGTWGADAGLDYWDLAANYVNVNGYTRYWDGQQAVPFLWKDLTRWVTYDDPQSLAGKATYARNQGLGGVFVWELSLEAAPSQTTKTYPLTNAVAGALNP